MRVELLLAPGCPNASAEPGALALVCSFVGVALAGVTGWLGGELVERLGVGVDDNAGVDAPSSLSRTGGRTRPRTGPAAAR